MSAPTPSPAPFFDGAFPHTWQAEILPARPLILPARHFTYPRQAEEVERGALEILVRTTTAPRNTHQDDALKGHDFSRANHAESENRALAPEGSSPGDSSDPNSARPASPQPHEFLATCALGFHDPAVPSGLWSTPHPDHLCAVSGGYAYVIDTTAPERFTMLPFRPVLEILPAPADRLLLFIGHHGILAWGPQGQAWQSEKLSDEGLTITAIEPGTLRGRGWNLRTDREFPFTLDLITGHRTG
jgi:hypothetical protein